MRNLRNRKLWAALLVCGAGTVFQSLPGGCSQYYTQSLLSSFDFCSVFNCEGGSFFNMCEPVALFVDCPTTPATTQ